MPARKDRHGGPRECRARPTRAACAQDAHGAGTGDGLARGAGGCAPLIEDLTAPSPACPPGQPRERDRDLAGPGDPAAHPAVIERAEIEGPVDDAGLEAVRRDDHGLGAADILGRGSADLERARGDPGQREPPAEHERIGRADGPETGWKP
jgi:hypothetical protein